MNKCIFLMVVVLGAVGCSSTSNYKPAKGSGYGYSETELTENRYRIDYKAKSHQAGKAKNYALLRAAELTLEQSYDWFVVVDRETRVEKTEDSISTSMQSGQTVTRSCGLLGCTTKSQPTTQYGVGMSTGKGADEAVASVEIRMGKGVKPASGDVYDAVEIKDNLGKR